jgi:hypothetical protein
MNSTTNTGVLAVVHESVETALNAHIRANENLTALPVIFASADADGASDYGLPIYDENGKKVGVDSTYWGVSPSTVARYRRVAEAVAKGDYVDIDLLLVVTAVNNAFRVKHVSRKEVDAVIEESETISQVLDSLQALIDGVVRTDDEIESGDADETDADETEVEAVETDKVLRWLTSPQGSLRKVLEAVQGGHQFTAEQAQAFDDLLSTVTGIASARAFVPAPVSVA